MKITESQLRKIIKEEIESITELSPAVNSSVSKSGQPKLSTDVVALKKKLDSLSSTFESAFKNINNPVEISQAISMIIDKISDASGVGKDAIIKALTTAKASEQKSG